MNKKNGFTLIELLVVIAIIGILAITVTPKLIKELNKAKVARVQHKLGLIRSKLSIENNISFEFPDLVSNNPDLLNKFDIHPTDSFSAAGNSYGKKDIVVSARDDTGGWYYIKEEGYIYANLPNGAYTGDSKYEIWNDSIETSTENTGEYNDPLGDNTWEDFIKGAIKENTWSSEHGSYGDIAFVQGGSGSTITPSEWHNDWEKVYVYDKDKKIIPNTDNEDGSYSYNTPIQVDDNNLNDYTVILEKTNSETGEKIYLYSDPK